MHDGIEQRRLGYLITLGGPETPVITERLQTVPLADWQPADRYIEFNAQIARDTQRIRQGAQRIAEMEWLIAIVRPLAKEPDALMAELVEQLPEPERTKAVTIMNARPPLEELPIERIDRQPWHSAIERAILLPHKGAFTMDDILAEAGIVADSADYPAALIYAQLLRESLIRFPAGVQVPVLTAAQTDKLQ